MESTTVDAPRRENGFWSFVFYLFIASLFLVANVDRCCAQVATIEKEATWQPKTNQEIAKAFEKWFDTQNTDSALREKVTELLLETQPPSSNSAEPIDLVIDAMSTIRPDVSTFRAQLNDAAPIIGQSQLTNLLENPKELPLVRDHVRLYYGRWLARNSLYDEAFEQLSKIPIQDVLDPSSLLFYRGLMEHQLLKKDACVETVEQLLENESKLPRRFAVLAQLMLSDIKPLKPDSLDEISRLMGEVGRRTGLYRSGKRVREQEEEVIKKLDKIIENIENQQQQMQMAQQQGGGKASKPMEESQRAAGKADGDVKSKTQLDGGQWGDLPPAERAAALAEMAKDMPPHYRAVIEEYFRKLAQENEKR
jgi:hypothetical protein